MPMPIEIVGLGKPDVRIVWDDDHEGTYAARELRLRCKCAHCVDEMTGVRVLDEGTVPERVTIVDMKIVGNYGLAIMFSDGHGTGIYRFAELLESCPCTACRARRA